MKNDRWLALFILGGFLLLSCSSESVTIHPNTLPIGFIDGANYEKESFYAVGWAADEEDGSPVKSVTVYIDNNPIDEAKLGINRPGVATEMKKPTWDKSGWEINTRVSLSKGPHTAYAVIMDKMGAVAKGMNEIKFEAK